MPGLAKQMHIMYGLVYPFKVISRLKSPLIF